MNKEQEQSIRNVEGLIQKMSLKKPDYALENRLGFESRMNERNRLREMLIALACLLAGVLIGRWMPGSNETEAAIKAVASSNSKDVVQSTKQTAASQPQSSTDSKVKLIDEGLFLMDGKIPVRKYTTISQQDITVVDPETGKPMTIQIPVRKTVVATAVGT